MEAPRDLCRPVSPQICRSLGHWGEFDARAERSQHTELQSCAGAGRGRFSLVTERVQRCLVAALWFRTGSCRSAILCLCWCLWLTPLSPQTRHPANTSWEPRVTRRQDLCVLPEAASRPAQGLLRRRVPAPVARPQRSGELATSANSPASQHKHFLHSSLCTPQTPPPAQPNPLRGFKGQSVFAVRGGLTMLSLVIRCSGRQRWEHWAVVCGVQAALLGSSALALHSPTSLLLVFLPKFPADLAI